MEIACENHKVDLTVGNNCDLGTISLTFTTLRKMGILQRVVNPFHKAYDAL